MMATNFFVLLNSSDACGVGEKLVCGSRNRTEKKGGE